MVKVLDQAHGNGWSFYHGDSVELIQGLPNNSIGYSIFSPPFLSLFTYSATERDLGNCRTDEEFYEHYKFLALEQLRILKPGRLMSVHCMNLPTSKERDGYIGLKDFRGDLIRLYQRAGFIYHSEVVIWKSPVVAMQRTKALGLLHKQLVKDSCMSRQGVPDYLVTFRKPGANDDPVTGILSDYHGENKSFTERAKEEAAQKYMDAMTLFNQWQKWTDNQKQKYRDSQGGWDFGYDANWEPEKPTSKFLIDEAKKHSIAIWQRYADPVWFDIDQSDTLNGERGKRDARDSADEAHLCALQLGVIRRSLQLWTNPGDVVFTPFGGIGSEPYVALEMGRRAIGFELKQSYYRQAVKNLRSVANDDMEQLSLLAV